MNAREAGFLLLTCKLGNPDRKVLTHAQLRVLSQRMGAMAAPTEDRDLEIRDLTAIGYGADMARRILGLLEEQELLDHYIARGRKLGCVPLARVCDNYPDVLRQRLGPEAPGCLWAKGDLSILDMPKIALVGSRDINPENKKFAGEVGRQAALQGYCLVSGNARGADRTAQNACLRHGGKVISIVADSLGDKTLQERVLYLSEEDFDEEFSAQRALSRNRVIHALGEKTFVAQSNLRMGGTWDGTVKNLTNEWSDVFCFADGSEAMAQLMQMGANSVSMEQLSDLSSLQGNQYSLFKAGR